MSFEALLDILVKYWPMFLRGAGSTIFVSMIGTILGSIVGLFVGIVRTMPMPERSVKRQIIKAINYALSAYIAFFRGTPMIVQAMVIYYGSAQGLGINMNVFVAALFIVTINTGAYMSEIVRGGIISIDKGQFEAAHAIGMNHIQTMVHIVLPQVIRNILPATGNEFVINIKDTSVLNVISLTELYFQTKSIAGNNYRYFEAFTITCFIYFILTYTVTKILRFIENKLDGEEHFILVGNQMQVDVPKDWHVEK